MLPEDLIIINGKRHIKTVSGKQYRLSKRLGSGGQAITFIICDAQNNKFVLKEYPVPKDRTTREVQRAIKRNLQALIRQPIKDADGKQLASMVPPIDLVDFEKTGSMGYIMHYVPIQEDNYLSIKNLLSLGNAYPDAAILTQIGWQMSHFFDVLAGSGGVCYKDINEGNIYLNPKTGDVKVIDNDNVGDPSTRTISGTTGYMAPEVLMGLKDPDSHTDRFQLATYLLRLFTGAYPYEGSKAVRYMVENEMGLEEAAPEVFGKSAVFIFHPQDKSNSIRVKSYMPPRPGGMSAQEQATINAWKVQATQWDRLPEIMKEKFITTFTKTTLADRQGRVTPHQWLKVFEQLKRTIITCPDCHKKTFGLSDTCFYCGSTKRKTVICKSCGKQTPQELAICIHCEKDRAVTPRKTIPCPHCKKENPEDAQRCFSCKGFLKVSCVKCHKTYPGDAKICRHCKTKLYSPCPKCRKDNPVDALSCSYCNTPFSKRKVQCGKCGRVNLEWYTSCIECGAPLTTSKKSFGFDVRAAGQTYSVVLEHEFGSGVVIYYADQLLSILPHVPLFRLRRNAQNGTFGIENKTGQEIKCKNISTGAVSVIKPDQVTGLEINLRLTFTNCVYQGKSVMILLKSII